MLSEARIAGIAAFIEGRKVHDHDGRSGAEDALRDLWAERTELLKEIERLKGAQQPLLGNPFGVDYFTPCDAAKGAK